MERIPDSSLYYLDISSEGGIYWVSHRHDEVAAAEGDKNNGDAKVKIKLAFWKIIFLIIMVLGLYSSLVHYYYGLGAISNIPTSFLGACGSVSSSAASCLLLAVSASSVLSSLQRGTPS